VPDYIITARAVHGEAFGDMPGPSSFLEVPDNAAEIAPANALPRQDWVRKVVVLAGLRRDATGVARGDVLVFVHGYDNTPTFVLQRHRRLMADLARYGYAGTVVSFDWPSGNMALAYVEDREKAKLTAFRLVKDCIDLLARMQGSAACEVNVHVLAHSTGAYVLREAFDDADDRTAIAAINWSASQIAVIGGDVSAESLADGNPEGASIYRHCQRLTNYSNRFDEVLQLSNVKRAGISPRVGRVGLPPDVPGKAVNVDCGEYYQIMRRTRPPTDIIGHPSHSWYIGDPVFTEDLAHTLNGDLDRGAIPTRAILPAGEFMLVKPQAFVATAAPVPVTPIS
jgi:pimeloyl-ACP methyl ester carboxylesterase